MSDKPVSTAKERFCFNCGASLGVVERRYYDSRDTCGDAECERAAHYAYREEREEAHERVDRDFDGGW
jgi:hypothetical protein